MSSFSQFGDVHYPLIPEWGARMTKRAPVPAKPSSDILMPVMERISCDRNSPKPWSLPVPLMNNFFLNEAETPAPSSSQTIDLRSVSLLHVESYPGRCSRRA